MNFATMFSAIINMHTQADLDPQTLQRWMSRVLARVHSGVASGESPFAAAVPDHNGELLACENNTVQGQTMVSRHAEINALDSACRIMGSVQLDGCTLVSSGEPCPICAAAAATAKISTIVFGADCKTIGQAGYPTLGLPCVKFFDSIAAEARIIGGVGEVEARQLLLDHPLKS